MTKKSNQDTKKGLSQAKESSSKYDITNYTTQSESAQSDKAQDEKLPTVRSVQSKILISPNDKLTHAVFGCDKKLQTQELFTQSEDEFIEIRTDARGKITILANLSGLPKNLQSKLGDRFTRAVCDSITSLKLSGNDFITPEIIAFAMNGYENRRTTDKFIEQIKETVEILSHTWCIIDAGEEAKARGYHFEKTFFKGILIPVDTVEGVFIDGRCVTAYKILREPILYKYAKQKGQFLTIDNRIIQFPNPDGKKRVNMTRENVILQRYLIERIAGMKNHKNKLSNVINYETIFEILNAQEFSKIEKKRIRDRVKTFLDNWVKLGFIASYLEGTTKGTRGRLIENISISLKTKKSKE